MCWDGCVFFGFLGGPHTLPTPRHFTNLAHRVLFPPACLHWQLVAVGVYVDVSYPDCPKIILVMDNLNTHTITSLYKTYPAEEAHRIARRLEIHFTPKHGSWLNMAEVELNVMTRQCLSRRIAAIDELRQELAAWETERNTSVARINWQFTTESARTKLISLYPKFDNQIPV